MCLTSGKSAATPCGTRLTPKRPVSEQKGNHMSSLATVIAWEVWLFTVALAAIVSYRLLTGRINTDGLLQDKSCAGGFSPCRLQLLLSTVSLALYYLAQVFSQPNPSNFPDLPTELLVGLGASHTLYHGSNAYSVIRDILAASGAASGAGAFLQRRIESQQDQDNTRGKGDS
jgi:hypothetical protein